MTLATIDANLRAAFRERLRLAVDVDVTVAATLARGVFTRTSGSWVDDGFAIGQELTVSGAASAVANVTGLTANALTTDAAGSATGSMRFQVKLPSAIAWEGVKYAPAGKPFVAERVQPAFSTRRSMGPDGAIEHRILGHAALFYPSVGSTLAIERMAGAIMAHFRPGVSLERGGDKAIVQNVERSPLMLDGEWLTRSVTVTFLAFTYA